MSDEVAAIEEGMLNADKDGGSTKPKMKSLWDLLLKIHLSLTIPAILGVAAWIVWADRSIREIQYAGNNQPEFVTKKDLKLAELQLLSQVNSLMAAHTNDMRTLVNNAVREIKSTVVDHTKLGGHPIMQGRMERVESQLQNAKLP